MEHDVVGKLRARLAAWRQGNPSRSLKIIAVAGEAGKTTTIKLLSEVLQETGRSVVALTDHGSFYNDETLDVAYDTSADDMQKCLALARKRSADYVLVEVTDKLIATHVLNTLMLEMSVVINDCPAAQELLQHPVEYTVVPVGFNVASLAVAPHQAISFGEDAAAEAHITSVVERRKGTEVEIVIDHQTKLPLATYLIGKANASNVAAAVSAAYVLAADTTSFADGIARLERVAGNYDYIGSKEQMYDVVLDRAHTETSLSLVMNTAKALKKRRLLVIADETIPSASLTMIKRLSDKVMSTAQTEVAGIERAESIEAAFELMTRGAKKDDVIILLGATIGRVTGGRTWARRLIGGDRG